MYIPPGGSYPIPVREEGDPSLVEIVGERHGLPLSSRSITEMVEDYNNEFVFSLSQKRSIERRSPKRFESQLAVEFLDEWAEFQTKVGKLTVQQAHAIDNLRFS